MANPTLAPVPYQTPLNDARGLLTYTWVNWLRSLARVASRIGNSGTTGLKTNTLGANGPNSVTTPYTWLPVTLADGTTGYFPVWK
jgi:hypothetical protein